MRKEGITMLKKAMVRGLFGFPVGVTIGNAINIAASLGFAPEGRYSAVVPEMAQMCGSEMAAVILQFVLCGVMGFVFAAMSVIWENEKLNLAAQSAINFVISVCTMIPIAYICYWMEHSLEGVLQYIGIFAGIYASVWVTMYFIYRAKVKAINRKINE